MVVYANGEVTFSSPEVLFFTESAFSSGNKFRRSGYSWIACQGVVACLSE